VALVLAGRACAQVAASASVASDYRYRGVSVSDGRPTLGLDLSYDRAGAYLGGSLIAGRLPGSGLGVIGSIEYLGYARRMGGDVVVDVGLTHSRFEQYYDTYNYAGSSYRTDTEAYAGLRTRHISYYVHYSPRYFGDGARTLYVEVDPTFPLNGRWRLFGHLGALTPLDRAGPASPREQYDARAGLAARYGRGELQIAWTSARPGTDPGYGPRRDAVIVSATCFF
jgi:uncharacterized protein (TIGR02001 family)